VYTPEPYYPLSSEESSFVHPLSELDWSDGPGWRHGLYYWSGEIVEATPENRELLRVICGLSEDTSEEVAEAIHKLVDLNWA
jgi:hypothetical protein